MRRYVAALVLTFGLFNAVQTALADDASDDDQFFVAMRTPQVDPLPRYVSLSLVATSDLTSTFSGCDGQTYYLSPADAATVTAAVAAHATVQLQTAPSGVAPEESSVICLVQASQ